MDLKYCIGITWEFRLTLELVYLARNKDAEGGWWCGNLCDGRNKFMTATEDWLFGICVMEEIILWLSVSV